MLVFQVTWLPPLNPNGEIHGYEIRLPEPRISHHAGDASDLNVTVTDLIPCTNYSITVLACSTGGGHLGGCTESLPTPAATLPTIPEGLQPLSVVAISESFLAVSWQPPRRPNGPNIRLEISHKELVDIKTPTLLLVMKTVNFGPNLDFHLLKTTILLFEETFC